MRSARHKKAPEIMPPQKCVRVLALSGEELMNVQIQDGTTVGRLKKQLQELTIVPRFRQRLVHEGKDLPNARILDETIELQLVKLNFIEATDEQVEELLDATAEGDVRKVERILQRPQDPNDAFVLTCERDEILDHLSPLATAAEHNNIRTMRLLVAAKADAQKQVNSSALHHATAAGYSEAVQLLLAARADAHLRHDSVALHLAAQGNHAKVLKILLRARADPHRSQPGWPGSPLSVACDRGNYRAAQVLLQHRAQPAAPETAEGFCPLDIAVARGNARIVQLLHEELHNRKSENPARTSAPSQAADPPEAGIHERVGIVQQAEGTRPPAG